MEYTVYCIETLNNGLKYYGRSQEYEKRKRSHLNMLRSCSHHSQLLQQNYTEYGESNLKFSILYIFDTLEDAQKKELELIPLGEYNVSKSSIGGGDNFSRHPKKEEIRKMYSERMSKERNHQYGKRKSDKMINSVKAANSKKIIVDGVTYASISEFSNQSGVKKTTVNYRLNSKNFQNYKYA